MSVPPDPLGIRAAAAYVLDGARDVSINRYAVEQTADRIAEHTGAGSSGPSWTDFHLGQRRLSPDHLATFVLVLDALNFCFWGDPRWRVEMDGKLLDGYWALTAALARALDEGYPITDAGYLARIPARDVAWILRGESIIPLFSFRVQNLREAGAMLLERWDGSFLRCVRSTDGSAVELLRQIITTSPSFVDVSTCRSRAIPFYKRAQILVSDLAASLNDAGEEPITGLTDLTAFADYKVPQVLHHLGVLRYSRRLRETLRRQQPVPAGSSLEVEIRAGTIAAVDQITRQLHRLGHPISDYQVDWYLWDLGQDRSEPMLPYHRTLTPAY